MLRSFHVMVVVMLAAGVVRAVDEVRYESMSPVEIEAAIARCPVAFFPAGINEWHGEQSAVGLDALKAEALCRMAARNLGGVVFPTLWTGPGVSTPFDPTKYPRGTLTIDKVLYLESVEELLNHVEAMGFKLTVYLSGHYPGVIEEVAKKFNQRGGMKVFSLSENLVVHTLPAGDHAGVWETSVLMALHPALVDLSRLPPLPAGMKHAGEVMPPAWPFLQRTEYYGVYGEDPRVYANAYFGREAVQAVMDGLAAKVRELTGDENYAQDREPIRWPERVTVTDEVRYDYQLPREWLERFEAAPVVYWPIASGGRGADEQTRRAVKLARQTGGLVFPAFPYAPGRGGTLSVTQEQFRRIVAEVVRELVHMDFRVIGLVCEDGLGDVGREILMEVAPTLEPGEAGLLVVGNPAGAGDVPLGVSKALGLFQPHHPSLVRISGPWQLDGKRKVATLTENVYGPAESVVYETTFTLTEAQAKQAALLDLGEVHNHAEVMVNNGPALVDHWPPYRFIVSDQLKPGDNRLKVVVRRTPQPTLDVWFYQPGLPKLTGPVSLLLWTPE